MFSIKNGGGNISTQGCCASKSYKVASLRTVRGISNSDDVGTVCCRKSICRRRCAGRQAGQRCYVVERTAGAILNVVFEVCANAKQVVARQVKPVPHGSADTPKRTSRWLKGGVIWAIIFCPTANLFRVARTKPHFVRLKPTTFVGKRSAFAVDAGSKLQFL